MAATSGVLQTRRGGSFAVHLRLGQKLAERIEALGPGGLKVAVDEMGAVSRLLLNGEEIRLDTVLESDMSKLVTCRKEGDNLVAHGVVIQRAGVRGGKKLGRGKAAAEGGREAKRLRMTDKEVPAEREAVRGVKRPRAVATNGDSELAAGGAGVKLPTSGAGKRRGKGQGPVKPKGPESAGHWLLCTFGGSEVSAKLIESLLQGVKLAQGPRCMLWVPSAAALKAEGCTCLVRLERESDMEVALMRDKETVSLPGDRGMLTVSIERCSELSFERVGPFGVVVEDMAVNAMLQAIQGALPEVAFGLLQSVWTQLIPMLRAGKDSTDDEDRAFCTLELIESKFFAPIDHAALMLAATTPPPPPPGQPAPLLSMSRSGRHVLGSHSALALRALEATRRGLTMTKHRLRGEMLARAGDLRGFWAAVTDPEPRKQEEEEEEDRSD